MNSNVLSGFDPSLLDPKCKLQRDQVEWIFETAGELMQFLQAVNWLRRSWPRMAEVVWPLRVFLEEHGGRQASH